MITKKNYINVLTAFVLLFPSQALSIGPGFDLKSPAFETFKPIPRDYTCDGRGISPELTWGDPPAETKAFALMVDDPDVEGNLRIYDHWVLFNIPAETRNLPAGIKDLPEGTIRGLNSKGGLDYVAPCPPKDDPPHRYYFKLFALRSKIDLPEGATAIQVYREVKRHMIEEPDLVGTYKRSSEY